MRILCSIILIPFFVISLSFSQTNWNWQNPIPQGNILEGIHAVNQDVVFAAGTSGTILKTWDGGANWKVIFPYENQK